jgi:lysophospholipase L1-like esterase
MNYFAGRHRFQTHFEKPIFMAKHVHSLLCLGDSYTIGEGVPLHQSFPYQVVQKLRLDGQNFHAPEIIAQTGWTTFELADFLIHHRFEQHYDFVTLLIGVNNQYRGLSVDDFAEEYEYLLKKAISLCAQHEKQVLAISIPDWGITPFAFGKNREDIANAIDSFNTTASLLAAKYNVSWLDITGDYRKTGGASEMLAADGLHPSGSIYQEWAYRIKDFVEGIL